MRKVPDISYYMGLYKGGLCGWLGLDSMRAAARA